MTCSTKVSVLHLELDTKVSVKVGYSRLSAAAL